MLWFWLLHRWLNKPAVSWNWRCRPGDLPGRPHRDHFFIYFGIKCSKSDTWTNSCVVRNKLLFYCTPAFVVKNLNDETSRLMLGVLQLITSEISYKIVWSCEMRVKSGTRWQHLIFNCTSCRLNLQMSCNDVTGQTPACPFTAQTVPTAAQKNINICGGSSLKLHLNFNRITQN